MDDVKFSTVVISMSLLLFLAMGFNACEKQEQRLHDQAMVKLKNNCKDLK